MLEPQASNPFTVGQVLVRLAALDAERLALLEELREVGFRSRSFVGEYAELLTAAVYGEASRARPSEPGFDLDVPGVGRVQVKALRSTPGNYRTSMGPMRDPYDVLFAIRLDAEYAPTGAWEIPRQVLELVYPHGRRTSLTARLLDQSGVRAIPVADLLSAAEAIATGELRTRMPPSEKYEDGDVLVRTEVPMRRSVFTVAEAQTIRAELRALRRADSETQKGIRRGLREMGFYISGYSASGDGFTESDFESLVRRGTITVE